MYTAHMLAVQHTHVGNTDVYYTHIYSTHLQYITQITRVCTIYLSLWNWGPNVFISFTHP